ncbi:hypothetical protein LTR78_003998 [Recurvomyces mirabilis]|uniref:INO80 complex subunit F domain-containing protein n=1 Tax=Recurvomyces mirabilis TaxID=574656 RepID=A0AAE0WRD5_9PEZI|nr:hypothetical protein LTR78_003998 [Recurvomyces mirabilis]KAK5153863.1 hypothetical protein LTS14_007083 [Recurvomyces mirabilis]
MPPPSEQSTAGTPLAPSVEKAYYRKCIELKRRLNEVEAANDEAKMRRVRLDRAIMKMRLERAFLLEQLSKRMEPNVDGSEGSGDEGVLATPPLERPHRDKRRQTNEERPMSGGGVVPILQPHPSSLGHAHAQHVSPYAQQIPPTQRAPSDPQNLGALNPSYGSTYSPPHQPTARPTSSYGHPSHESPYRAPVGMPGATVSTQINNIDGTTEEAAPSSFDRAESVTGQALTAGPRIRADRNGERRAVAEDNVEVDGDELDPGHGSLGGGGTGGDGFPAVNQQ